MVGGPSTAWRLVAVKGIPAHPPGPLSLPTLGGLFITSGLNTYPWLDPRVRWRLRQGLALCSLASLRPRLGRRAEAHRFHAHPSKLHDLIDRPDLVKSGGSAAGPYELGLVPGEEVDGYVRARVLKRIQRDHSLESAEPNDGNVVLRVVPNHVWQMDSRMKAAPLAAVAIDLAEDPDSRSSHVGKSVIEQLDRDLRDA